MSADPNKTTRLLDEVREGSDEARNELIDWLYDRFRQRARQRLRHERPDHSLSTEDLTDEALARLIKDDELVKATDGNQLFRAFARAMQQLLVDHARRRGATKRGGGWQRVELDDLVEEVQRTSQVASMEDLQEALDKLAKVYPREAEVVQMRLYGFEMAEIANALGVAKGTVEKDHRFAQAQLRLFLTARSNP